VNVFRAILMGILACVTLVLSLGSAQTTNENSAAKVQRKGVAVFSFEPKSGRMDLGVFGANGTDAIKVDSLQVNAIGDQWERGRTVPGNVERAGGGSFIVTFGLPEGEWNMHLKAVVDGQSLEGLYLLSVGKFPTKGQFALTAPSPEVNRMVWIVSLMLGVPIALGVLLTLFSMVSKAQQAARLEV
jgi:hypothetical protein